MTDNKDPTAATRWDLAWRRWHASVTYGATPPLVTETITRLDHAIATEDRDALFRDAPTAEPAQRQDADGARATGA